MEYLVSLDKFHFRIVADVGAEPGPDFEGASENIVHVVTGVYDAAHLVSDLVLFQPGVSHLVVHAVEKQLASAAFRAVLLKVVKKRFAAIAGDLGRQTHVSQVNKIIAVAAPGETVCRAPFKIAGESFLRHRADRQETDGVSFVGQLFAHRVNVACASVKASDKKAKTHRARAVSLNYEF